MHEGTEKLCTRHAEKKVGSFEEENERSREPVVVRVWDESLLRFMVTKRRPVNALASTGTDWPCSPNIRVHLKGWVSIARALAPVHDATESNVSHRFDGQRDNQATWVTFVKDCSKHDWIRINELVQDANPVSKHISMALVEHGRARTRRAFSNAMWRISASGTSKWWRNFIRRKKGERSSDAHKVPVRVTEFEI